MEPIAGIGGRALDGVIIQFSVKLCITEAHIRVDANAKTTPRALTNQIGFAISTDLPTNTKSSYFNNESCVRMYLY